MQKKYRDEALSSSSLSDLEKTKIEEIYEKCYNQRTKSFYAYKQYGEDTIDEIDFDSL